MNDTSRKMLGLSQELMASWLRVPRSTLAQVESGRRYLPSSKWVQDMRLYLAVQGLVMQPVGAPDTTPLPAPAPLPAPPIDRAPLDQRLAECRYHVRRLRYALENMQRQAAPHEARLKALPALRAWTGPVDNPAREENWLALIEEEALSSLQYNCGAGPQRLLEARIAGLERETELLEQTLAARPAEPTGQ